MKTYTNLLLIVILSVGLLSCGDNPAGNQTENGNALVNVEVDWNSVNDVPQERFTGAYGNESQNKVAYKAQGDTAIAFGVRIEYLAEDAVYTQAVTNTNGDSTALVTLDIPTADSVAVYAVAVDDQKVINMGVIKQAVINNATEYNFTVNDFKWDAPSWGAGPDFEPTGWDTAYASKKNPHANISFKVVNPFNKSMDDGKLKMGINSSGGGFRAYEGNNVFRSRIRVDRPNTDTTTTTTVTTETWWPYLRGEMFGLDNLTSVEYQVYDYRFIVDKQASFHVTWE